MWGRSKKPSQEEQSGDVQTGTSADNQEEIKQQTGSGWNWLLSYFGQKKGSEAATNGLLDGDDNENYGAINSPVSEELVLDGDGLMRTAQQLYISDIISKAEEEFDLDNGGAAKLAAKLAKDTDWKWPPNLQDPAKPTWFQRIVAITYSIGNGTLYAYAVTQFLNYLLVKSGVELDYWGLVGVDGACEALMVPLMYRVHSAYLPKIQATLKLSLKGKTPWGVWAGISKGSPTAGAVFLMLQRFTPDAYKDDPIILAIEATISVWFGFCHVASEGGLFCRSDVEKRLGKKQLKDDREGYLTELAAMSRQDALEGLEVMAKGVIASGPESDAISIDSGVIPDMAM